jgi:hypothetical protein
MTRKRKLGNINNKEINALVEKPTITETVRLIKLLLLGHVQGMEENRIPSKVQCVRKVAVHLGYGTLI